MRALAEACSLDALAWARSSKICRRPMGTSSERVMREPGCGGARAAERPALLAEGLPEARRPGVAWGEL